MVTPSQHTQASMKVPNVRVLVQMLQAIKCTGKQVTVVTCCKIKSWSLCFYACKHVSVLIQYCTVLMGPEGLSVRWEIDSKTLQSSIFLRPEVRFLWLHAVQKQ